MVPKPLAYTMSKASGDLEGKRREELLEPWIPPADALEAEWKALERTIDAEELQRVRAFRGVVEAAGLDRHEACASAGATPHSRSASTLLRFLRARQGDANAALKLFVEAMDWRRDFDIDRKLKEWRAEWEEGTTARVQLLKAYDFISEVGKDNLGLPVFVQRHSQGDAGGIVREAGQEALLLHLVSGIEYQLSEAKARMLKTGECVTSFIEIQDVGNYGLVDSWLPRALACVPFYKANAPIFDKVYPERVRICFIIRAPTAFAMIWRLASPMVPEATKGKIRLKGSGAKTWMEEMAAHMPLSSIPPWVQSDDPAELAKAKPWGGVVPKGAIEGFKR